MSAQDIRTSPRFHPRYKFRFPQQVILVASDNLHFAVFKEDLLFSSQVFATAFSFPQPESHPDSPNVNFDECYVDALAKAIHIEASEKVSEWFIVILGSTQPICPMSDLEDTVSLIELCEKYEISSSIIKVLKDRMQNLIDNYPWKWLELASKLDDREMGGKALRKMGQEGFLNGDKPITPHSTLWNRLSRLDPKWVIPLMSMAFSLPSDTDFPDFYSSSTAAATFQSGNGKSTEHCHGKTIKTLRSTQYWIERCDQFVRGQI
ncbi:hypothetical protein I302_103922 [Kwoniella bestiolae CBS 10118]|uniref:BTB domain-containing protein n=1 Tax=Kwoniella bestiolae CBS 10118 TaxID=1296100 RepID=A0A1B9G9S2_9TREE|nr:hypothetical protein I302_02627 [Kwoniella bestiolae CBS 10118]OCF27778.1 hypothetical protein I302_02627 [Kwoniella bestiolae CBS 10118]